MDGGGDLVVPRVHVLDRGADRLERLAGPLDPSRRLRRCARAPCWTTSTVRRVSGWIAPTSAVIEPAAGATPRRACGPLGDDGEAAALLARARRLDGGVEREQVGLGGDGGDRLDDAADLLGLGAELADGGGRRATLATARHGGGRLAHASAPAPARPRASSAAGAVRWAPSADCVVAPATSATVSRAEVTARTWRSAPCGDLLDGAGDLAHRAAGLLGAVGQLRARRRTRRSRSATPGRPCRPARRGRRCRPPSRPRCRRGSRRRPRRRRRSRRDVRRWMGGVTGVSSKVRSPSGEVSEPVAQAGHVVAAQGGEARDDRLHAEADAADGEHARGDGDEEDQREQREHEPARVVEGRLGRMGELVALGDLRVVEVLEVGVEGVGGGIQALRGPLVGEHGRVRARDAEQLAGHAPVLGEVVLQEARAAALQGGGEGGGGQPRGAGDPVVVGQDAPLERALGLERVLEDVAVGESPRSR